MGVGGSIVPLSPITEVSDGTHIKIFHRNHGMHGNGSVTLKTIQTDVDASALTVAYPNTSSGGDAISVSPVGIFTMFENLDVAITNPGYVTVSYTHLTLPTIYSV